MEMTKAAVGVFAVACMTAGAGGAYLATRGDHPVAAQSADGQDLLVSHDPLAPRPVDQSEGLIVEPPAARTSSPPEPVPAPAPRVAASPRPTPPPAAVPRPAPRASAPAPAEVVAAAPEPPVAEPQQPELQPIPPPQVVDNEASRWVPPAPVYDAVIVPVDAVIGLQVETAVSSETAQIEDRVTARVTRDVRVGERVAIPAGTRLEGSVTEVVRGGRVRERARLGVRFTSLVLADGTRQPVTTETIYREGDSPGNESAAKIGGGAIGGAIIGGILGGAKGAAIGGSAGAGAGTAAVLAGGRNPATLQAGTPVTVRVERPIEVLIEP